ncbi:hypothetical protein [Variovorax sp. JS1663]|uniref:hypothetical protein n=1 Tax=Variovorax sp. JS1663 TaxID=1851577 RepID=UPI000B344EDD|nr:hypothetical protein [Variovorax sp. JS1663]OUM01739.1 hypothetical protein A8M77_14350 [Variovorax sp. JS1663]
MPDFDWKRLVAGVAPALGTVLGGPLIGAAVAELGAALLGNRDATEADIAAALSSGRLGPEQVVAIKQAENALTIELARIEQAREAAGLQDTSSARQQTVALAKAGSGIAWGAPVVSTLIVSGYFFCIYRLFIVPTDLPPNAFQLLNVMFGALSIAFGQVCNYWLGSSAGSKASGDAVRKIAQQNGAR